MVSTDFHTTPHIVCEPNSLRTHLGKISADFLADNALIVTDKALVNLGFVDIAITALKEANISATVFDEVIADPPVKVVDKALKLARDNNCNIIIALGGGSTIDTAKIIALHKNNFASASELFNRTLQGYNKVPLIAIPTTAGTGAEVTFVSVVTAEDGSKFAIYTPKILPDVALLDANLTLNLPKHITSATALDAMVHCIEAYTSRTKKNPLSDALAIKGLQLLWSNYRCVIGSGSKDLSARSAMLLGSCLAGMAFVNASVAAVHGLSYPLSIKFHIPHGHANALVMAGVFHFNCQNMLAQSQYAELARAVMPNEMLSLSDEMASKRFIEILQQFLNESSLPTRLSELSITKQDIQELAEMVVDTYARLITSNAQDMNLTDIITIYEGIL